MKADFNLAFNELKNYFQKEIPELGGLISHWEDPYTVTKNRAIILPDAHSGAGNRADFAVLLCVSIVEKNADAIAKTQMEIMEKVFKAVYSDRLPSPIISAAVNSADYFNPAPQSQNVGIIYAVIGLVTEYLDDCSMG